MKTGEIFKKEDFDFFRGVVREAGNLALKHQKHGLTVKRKNDSTIVTEADYAVQEYLIENISRRYQDFNFIHEENFGGLHGDIDEEAIYVIIDPIDGTAVFSMLLPTWCVSVGIFKGYSPLYGFVYSPGSDLFFYNDEDAAYLNDNKIEVEAEMKIDSESNLFYASEIQKVFSIDFPGKIRNIGSTALQASLTIDNARNRTVGFIGKSYIWDWAGALPVILKAGGRVCYISGKRIDFKKVYENDFEFCDFLVVHNSMELEVMRKFFKILR